ncbi:MAG: hypothetical protein M3327_09755 [Actinomycetota bacterium]|nr:hypothetical protein [Actinomycetota bacterium]
MGVRLHEYDYTNKKLKAYRHGASTDANVPLPEAANGVNLSAVGNIRLLVLTV